MRKLSIVITALCFCTAFAMAASAQDKTLCERLGGTTAISAVVGFGVGTLVAAMSPRLRGSGRRVIEISMSFPPILLALFLVTIFGAGAKGAVIAIGLGAAPGFARLAENYATSLEAGRPMLEELRRPRVLFGSTECSACRMQMEHGSGKRALHPIQYLALSYGLMPSLAGRLKEPIHDLVLR